MTTREELKALAETVQKLTGPDRMVAKLIFAAVYPDGVPSPVVEGGYGWRDDDSGWWLATGEDARTPPKRVYPPNWLGSLDAAMSLVPGGWIVGSIQQSAHAANSWCVRLVRTNGGNVELAGVQGFAPTPALALTAASLLARAKQMRE
jgi:hypothetical protein